MTKRLLVTGASGFLGWHLCQEAHDQGWQVHGTYLTNATPVRHATLHQVNLTDPMTLREAIASLQPDAIIHAAAQARPNQCEQDPDQAYAINVEASVNLAKLCCDSSLLQHRQGSKAPTTQPLASIPCLFVSTNQVFDGSQAPYSEADPVSPINVYGKQKVMAERQMQAHNPQTIICRMPLMFGCAPTAPSFLQGFLQRIARQEPLKLFVDEYRTPLSAIDAAQGILLALAQDRGIFHLGGPQRLSRHEFGQLLVEVLGVSIDVLQPCRQADVLMAAARPADLTMDSSRAQHIGYHPTKLRTALEALDLRETMDDSTAL